MTNDATRRAFGVGIAAIAAMLMPGCVSMQKYDQLEQDYQQLRTQMASELNADQVEITKLQGELRVTFKDEILFPEGGWRLSGGAEQTLHKLVPTLQTLQQTKIVVKGYTDNLPIGPELERKGISDNLDLSSKRADAVVTYLQRQGVSPGLMSGQGFGANDPIVSNATPAGRAKNRRIEVALVGPGN